MPMDYLKSSPGNFLSVLRECWLLFDFVLKEFFSPLQAVDVLFTGISTLLMRPVA
jgi:hypothetical protein